MSQEKVWLKQYNIQVRNVIDTYTFSSSWGGGGGGGGVSALGGSSSFFISLFLGLLSFDFFFLEVHLRLVAGGGVSGSLGTIIVSGVGGGCFGVSLALASLKLSLSKGITTGGIFSACIL